MRCPECKHTQKYREGTRCKKCGYQFVFRKSADGITDSALRQMIQRLSDSGQQAFTATQLALAICRSWRQKKGAFIGCGVVAVVVALLIGFGQHALLGVAVFLILSIPIIVGWWGRARLLSTKRASWSIATIKPIRSPRWPTVGRSDSKPRRPILKIHTTRPSGFWWWSATIWWTC